MCLGQGRRLLLLVGGLVSIPLRSRRRRTHHLDPDRRRGPLHLWLTLWVAVHFSFLFWAQVDGQGTFSLRHGRLQSLRDCVRCRYVLQRVQPANPPSVGPQCRVPCHSQSAVGYI